ncbi:MAG: peptidase M28 family protein, partial [Gammaproteobacteria bacterium]|nr:peptidase M28 family protein [Gammaproteobacteria bacterium]
MRTTIPIAFLTLLVFAPLVSAQSIPAEVGATAAKLRDAALSESIAYDLVESLTMEVGPRLAGSAGDAAAVAWAIAKMKELGFERVHADPVEVPHWDRGTLDVRVTAPYPQRLTATSLGGSPGTPYEGIEGQVVRVESLAELRALSRQQLSGRIAFVDHVMERHRDGSGYSPASRIRGCGHVVAAERGALATII